MNNDLLCVNTIRILSADVVQKANSGHPGAPMGMAPLAHLLWTKFLKYNPSNPKWFNRDRFVLSNGHACALLYSMLHLTGYDEFTLDELKKFRQVGSKTPGHPESDFIHGGIEVTTGPLGQGISNAVGLAIASAHYSATFNKPGFPLIDNYTFVFCGDGCLQEGISSEAASLAGHLGLGRLIVFYDDNKITIDGETELSFTEDVNKRFESYGWHVQTVKDGDHDLAAISAAVEEAKKVHDRPSFIKVRTTIGFGSVNQGTEKVHGNPLGNDNLAAVKKLFGFDSTQFFHIPDEVKVVYAKAKENGKIIEAEWNSLFEKYSVQFPELAVEFRRRMQNKLPNNWRNVLPTYKPEDPAKATRQFSQTVINALAKILPEMIGGSADLNPSTLSYMECSKDFQKETPEGRNIRFGVREHAMAAICNGLHAFGGLISYGSTFLNFIDYAMGAVRLSAISHFGVLYVMTHDSIGLGEDGPTHQPINALMTIRTEPNILLIRPADGNEVSGAYAVAIENRNRPSVLCFSRQAVPNIKGSSIDGVSKGAYIISDPQEGKPQIILVGSGSELSLCVSAAIELKDLKVRVVSMPSWELFRAQSTEYQLSVFPNVPVLAVEAGSVVGWQEYAHVVIGMSTFGSSGPAKDVFKKFGFTVENIVDKARKLIEFYSKHPCESKVLKPW
jgi:transketolase